MPEDNLIRTRAFQRHQSHSPGRSLIGIKLIPLLLPALLLPACSAPEAAVAPEAARGRSAKIRSLPSVWTPTAEDAPAPTRAPTTTPSPTPTELPFSSGPVLIGRSVAGRPLEVYRFGTGPSRRLIVAGIHGGYEWNTSELARQMMDHLEQNPEMIPDSVTLYILPSLNPDGEARSRGYEGRANENGVDLNRNWPAHWAEEWPVAGCWNYLPITGGPAPVSEPEVAALMHFITSGGIEALISYHSAALGIFAGGRPSTQESLSLAEAVAAVSPYPYPPLQTGCDYTGQFSDWATENGIPAIDVELTTHYSIDLEINLRILEVFLHWSP